MTCFIVYCINFLCRNETLSCYYYLLRQASRQEADIDQEGHPTYFYTSNNEYVVCLLTDDIHTLELFRPELDAYSEGLLAVLDNEVIIYQNYISY